MLVLHTCTAQKKAIISEIVLKRRRMRIKKDQGM